MGRGTKQFLFDTQDAKHPVLETRIYLLNSNEKEKSAKKERKTEQKTYIEIQINSFVFFNRQKK